MSKLIIRQLGSQPYESTWRAMQEFTDTRTADTSDELWLVEHPPVFTLGQAGKLEHIHDPVNIPVVNTDRGGQVTYHGPGQMIGYCLMDLRRHGIGPKGLVCQLEKMIIDVLAKYDIRAARREKAPGVYVDNAKIAALGLRIRRGYSYHGWALNIDMDLAPFAQINPCGIPDLAVTQLSDLVELGVENDVQAQVIAHFSREFGYNSSFGEYDAIINK